MTVGGLGVLVVSGGITSVAVRVISSPLELDRGGVGVLANVGALAGTGVHLGGGVGGYVGVLAGVGARVGVAVGGVGVAVGGVVWVVSFLEPREEAVEASDI